MERDREAAGFYGFDEARAPCGSGGNIEWLGNILLPYRETPSLDAVLAARVAGRPWFLALWEPLPAGIPGPATAQPYACYSNTVIFYAVDAWGKFIVETCDDGRSRRFREHARCEYTLYGEDVFGYGGAGERFVREGGRVCWRAAPEPEAPARWWVCHCARRIHPDDENTRARADYACGIVETKRRADEAVAAIVAGWRA